MSTGTLTTSSGLSAQAHNVLFSISGLIAVVATLHGDLNNILTMFATFIPMIAGLAHLIYSEKAKLSAAFDAGQTATITQTTASLATVLSNASSDINSLKAVAGQVVAAVNAANAS